MYTLYIDPHLLLQAGIYFSERAKMPEPQETLFLHRPRGFLQSN